MSVILTTENLGFWNNWLKLFRSSITATVQWITKSIRDPLKKECKDFIWLFSSSKKIAVKLIYLAEVSTSLLFTVLLEKLNIKAIKKWLYGFKVTKEIKLIY